MTKQNNRIVVNLNKVTHARLRWRVTNVGYESYRDIYLESFTIYGQSYSLNDTVYNSERTVLTVARERGMLDKWERILELQLSNNHSLIYTGDKALSLWKAWCAKQFGKDKEKK